MTNQLNKFKRYNELLNKVYGSKGQATGQEMVELGNLSFELGLEGVPEYEAEMNYQRLQKELERSI